MGILQGKVSWTWRGPEHAGERPRQRMRRWKAEWQTKDSVGQAKSAGVTVKLPPASREDARRQGRPERADLGGGMDWGFVYHDESQLGGLRARAKCFGRRILISSQPA